LINNIIPDCYCPNFQRNYTYAYARANRANSNNNISVGTVRKINTVARQYACINIMSTYSVMLTFITENTINNRSNIYNLYAQPRPRQDQNVYYRHNIIIIIEWRVKIKSFYFIRLQKHSKKVCLQIKIFRWLVPISLFMWSIWDWLMDYNSFLIVGNIYIYIHMYMIYTQGMRILQK